MVAQPPLIVRIAGLSAEVMEAFSSRPLLAKVAELGALQQRLEHQRAVLVGCLHDAIHEAPKDHRAFLLSVKRDCFNARSLARHQSDPRWFLLAGIGSSLAAGILDLELRAETAASQARELYHEQLGREWSSLQRLLSHRAFVRGVTLASPDLASNLHRLQKKSFNAFGRKEKRLALSLLRYTSRTALKLSPFSTLTRAGLGAITRDGAPGFELPQAGQWRERPVVRLHRELLAQCLCLLLDCPELTRHLQVRLNDSLQSLGDGRYSFFRSGHWELDEEDKAFKYRDEAFIKVRLEGSLVSRLTTELGDESDAQGDLLDRLASGGEDREPLAEMIADLLRLGFLTYVLPWDANGPDLEDRILSYLQALPQSASLAAFTGGLRELFDSLYRYSESASPLRCIEECRRGVARMFQSTLPLLSRELGVEFKASNVLFKEDVFVHAETREIARLSRDRAEEILGNLDPLVRLANLDSSRYDLLHALAALASDHFPGEVEIDFLEFYRASQPVFREYVSYKLQLFRYPALLAPGFNPFGLTSVASLVQSRRSIASRLGECLRRDGQAYRLCPHTLSALLDQVPQPYAAPRDFCAFIQPLDAAGRTWVVNKLFDGYGRLSSRYTSAMDEETRESWVRCFTALSYVDLHGERAEIVDVSCPDRHNLNVHEPQTARVLRLPGDSSTLPAERLLRLRDLRVRLRGPEDLPVLTDRAGQRLLPVHLGGLSPVFVPPLLKLLAVFGPGELPLFSPGIDLRREGKTGIVDRHQIGNVVYIRKRWVIEPRRLLSLLAGDEARTFATVNRWRSAQGIPDRVFVTGSVNPGSEPDKKPQYVDFSSPLLVQIFESILRSSPRPVSLVEALPAPEQFPVTGGRRWGVELQLETFGMGHQAQIMIHAFQSGRHEEATTAR